jgi:hypothetical protein
VSKFGIGRISLASTDYWHLFCISILYESTIQIHYTMLRFVVACCIILLIATLFIFSRSGKDQKPCSLSMEGTVREHRDSTDFYLYIESKDQKRFFPQIEQNDVVLASGARVNICYDTTGNVLHDQPVIRITSVTYLP